MLKHVETILTSAGLAAEDIAALDKVPEAEHATYDVKSIVDKVKNNYTTQIANDPSFFTDLTLEKLPATIKKQVENASFGRASKIVTDKFLKGIGLTEADYADLPQETKDKIELLIPAIAEKWTKTKSTDKQLQQDLIDARKQLEKYGPDYETTIENKHKTASEQRITAAIFNAALVGELSTIPGLKIAASDIAKTAKDILESKYGFERVGDYAVELRQKDNPQMKVLKTGSSQELTLKEALLTLAGERGWIEKEPEKQKGEGKFRIEPEKGELKMAVIAPHLQDKISKKIAAEG